MTLRRQLNFALPTALLLALWLSEANVATVAADDSISNLYENLLQREYPGPVVFPNHQVERKAQRSPSLRLRFGRRNDPDLLPSAQKRWFGDVHQKPIRSPSLRLRFGRRSDPGMPMHSNFDLLMNSLASNVNSNMDDNALEQDYDIDGNGYDVEFERAIRKPQRLRWGRSVPVHAESYDDDVLENEQQQLQHTDELLNSLMNSEKFRNLLMNLRRYDDLNNGLAAIDTSDSNEFARVARKPAPLRLRWGRSTGGATHSAANADNAGAITQNKNSPQSSVVAGQAKTSNQKNQEKKN